MSENFNNYSLSNLEIEKILLEFELIIKKASKIDGQFYDECAQQIRISIFRKLSKNYKK